jgi:endonuclease G
MGYNETFLKHIIEVPSLQCRSDAYELDGSISIGYTHFSLALSKTKKFAIWVAWNIDGNALKRLSREGIPFSNDPRIPDQYQAGNKLYGDNPLDRGHIARRVDLVWGEKEEARKANIDSFTFTNIAPQMASFNQSNRGGIWGKLENSIYEQVAMDKARVSVMAGPFFDTSDRTYRGFKIPAEFYKTLLYERDGELGTKSFILTQDLDKLSIPDLEEYEVYEVMPTEIENKGHFTYDNKIREANTFEVDFNLAPRAPITNTDQINW